MAHPASPPNPSPKEASPPYPSPKARGVITGLNGWGDDSDAVSGNLIGVWLLEYTDGVWIYFYFVIDLFIYILFVSLVSLHHFIELLVSLVSLHHFIELLYII